MGDAHLESVMGRVDAERAEVALLLNSKTFGRSNNLGRVLSFICDKYFDGAASEIKEYSIAVHALGRAPDFDPQTDSIVRVTAHNLRKQLETYYRTDGAGHAVHICLPPGHYVPEFVHSDELGRGAEKQGIEPDGFGAASEQVLDASFVHLKQSDRPIFPNRTSTSRLFGFRPRSMIAVLAFILAGALSLSAYYFWKRTTRTRAGAHLTGATVPSSVLGPDIHALLGADRVSYVDRAGISWQTDRFCTGGDSFSVTGHTIQGTQDPELFLSGRRGIFNCSYPVPPGIYEIRLLFAETSGLQENSRNVGFSINGGPVHTLDVVDDAAGDDSATTKVYTGVEPRSDGMIHISFTTPESFVNAIEILPGTPHRMLPTRIAVGHSAYRDAAGNVWAPDQYFYGGRLSRFGGDLSKTTNSGILEWHRFGHFHYLIPVATGAKYTVKLYFFEHWFGAQNGGVGGAGSRVFDVSCNGSVLLKDFDIYREAGSEPLVKTFNGIEPTAQGKIELYFTPSVNYPSISAIEVIPE